MKNHLTVDPLVAPMQELPLRCRVGRCSDQQPAVEAAGKAFDAPRSFLSRPARSATTRLLSARCLVLLDQRKWGPVAEVAGAHRQVVGLYGV